MSRIGFKPVVLPEGVTAEFANGVMTVKGPKGELSVSVPALVSVEVKDGAIHCTVKGNEIEERTLHGTTRANIHNAVVGVSEGFKKELEIVGIGYRCAEGTDGLVLNVGFSHEVIIPPMDGVKVIVKDETHIIVEGIDKQKVGQVAALIHDTKRPEPYGGKGIKYKGEHIIRKEGKRAAGGKK
ncbi:MAG: 50S ribosomal protein L6 [Candidatus Enteromonas sp.]|nr:50S ribosomal protein L6 [Candidatus Enteromonas sp.]